MSADLLEFAALAPKGKSSADDRDEVGEPSLRPALLAAYRELAKLRHDYPLVLTAGDGDAALARSLSDVIDEILRDIAPRGMAGERLRKHVLGLEDRMRALVSHGAKESLSLLWDLAENDLFADADGADGSGETALRESLSAARGALRFDGPVIDCDAEAPARLLTHGWTVAGKIKAERFLDRLDGLILKLSDILKADFMKSDEARSPDRLERSLGPVYGAVFDFDEMSRILGEASPNDVLSASRRQRIRAALSVLESQRFFVPGGGREKGKRRQQPHSFVFDSCTRALEAFEERLPEMVEVIKAMSIAELEIANRYKATRHDSFFGRFDRRSLTPDDVALFPSYLVCLRNGHYDAAEQARLIEALSSGLPVKVLVQSDDILEEAPVGAGQFSFGIKSVQLATMALGLNSAYVLQSGASHLYRLRDRILKGMTFQGPALFSIFSGAVRDASGAARNALAAPPYLMAAAAMESRAFPAFTYDPAAGRDWAARFCIGDNPQAEAPWPVHRLRYEDEDLQRMSDDVAFTFVDFVACDGRYRGCFARVPRSEWREDMVPASEVIERAPGDAPENVPYIPMIDEDDVLHRVVVADELIDAARRCGERWRSLQELGGIDNSHATRLLARERAIWEEEKARELAELRERTGREAEAPVVGEAAQPPQEIAPVDAEEPAEEAPTDEPYIETPRCTTCDECIELNKKMFAYDDNKQAYIADPDAGPYRELVEAAEVCQVCIVHPGKPRNPNEADLAELIERAEPFN